MTAPSPGALPIHLKVAEAFVRAREAMRPGDRAHADARLTQWVDAFEADMRDTAVPLLQAALDHPDTPDDVRAALGAVLQPEHATSITPLFAVVGALFYPLVSATMTARVQALEQLALRGDPNTKISPAEVALARIKNTPMPFDPYDEVANFGIDHDRLDVLVANTGNPPGPGELTSLLNRGIIDVDTWTHGIRQGRLRDEWADPLLRGRLDPVGPAAVINGVLKQRLDPNEGAKLFEQAGGDTTNWSWLIAAAGRPYGTHEALDLWNRARVDPAIGIDEARVREVIAHSDINPEFTDDVLKLRWYIPPVRSILPMLRAGSITDAEATDLFKANGLRDQDIPHYLAEAKDTRTATVKHLSQSQVVRMYLDGIIDHATAEQRLVALGYIDGDANMLLALADDVRRERYANAIVTRLHSLYVAHKATDTDVQTALQADGISAAAIGELLTLWKIEQTANVHAPSVPQVLHAYRQGVLSPRETRDRLFGLGVQVDDLAIVVANGFPPTMHGNDLFAWVAAVLNGDANPPAVSGGAPSLKHLTRADIVNLYENRTKTRAEAVALLVALGYTDQDANTILDAAGPPYVPPTGSTP